MNSSINKAPSIQAYFSHSYRKDDRSVNLFFWKLFNENGFFFAIDPKSDDNSFNITYLERLMRFSDCFISVVTRRKKEGSTGYTHSPYLAFENFLAELAGKPRLVFVEHGLDINVFGSVHTFKRDRLEIDENRFERIVQDFSTTVQSYQSYNSSYNNGLPQRPDTNQAGILIKASEDPSGYSQEMIDLITNLLSETINHSAETLPPRVDYGLQKFIRKVSGFDLVVIDVCDPFFTPEVLAIIQAKAIPCVRLAKLGSNGAIDGLKAKGVLRDYFIGSDSPLIMWKDSDELREKLEKYLNKFNQEQERIFYKTYDSGQKYFKSAGRRPAHIFISNPASLQDTANKLSEQFESIGLGVDDYFQYQSNSSIPTGTEWPEELDKVLMRSNLFIVLLNEDYILSENCMHELEIAVARSIEGVVIQAYNFGGKKSIPGLIKNLQIQDLGAPSENDELVSRQISKILVNIETELDKPEPEKKGSAGPLDGMLRPGTAASGLRGATVVNNYNISQTISGSTIQGSIAAAGGMTNSLNTAGEEGGE